MTPLRRINRFVLRATSLGVRVWDWIASARALPSVKKWLRWSLLLPAVFSFAAPSPDYRLEKGRVGRLSKGMSVAEVHQVYPLSQTTALDLQWEGEPTPVLEIYTDQTKKFFIMRLHLDQPGGAIQSFWVMDSRFKTKEGLGPRSSVGALRRAYKGLSVLATEWEMQEQLQVEVPPLGMLFELDADTELYRRVKAIGNKSLDQNPPLCRIKPRSSR